MAFKKYTGDKMKSPMKQGVIMDDRSNAVLWMYPKVDDSDSTKVEKRKIISEIGKAENSTKRDSIMDHHLKNNPMYNPNAKSKNK